jgi:hypothetical protein
VILKRGPSGNALKSEKEMISIDTMLDWHQGVYPEGGAPSGEPLGHL